jgi:hypothetical protein
MLLSQVIKFWIFCKKETKKAIYVLFSLMCSCLITSIFFFYINKEKYDNHLNDYNTKYYNISEGYVKNCKYYKRDAMKKLSSTKIIFNIKNEEFIVSQNSFGIDKYKELSVIQNGMNLRICYRGGLIFTIEQVDCKSNNRLGNN